MSRLDGVKVLPAVADALGGIDVFVNTVSSDAAYFTGADLRVDGGAHT